MVGDKWGSSFWAEHSTQVVVYRQRKYALGYLGRGVVTCNNSPETGKEVLDRCPVVNGPAYQPTTPRFDTLPARAKLAPVAAAGEGVIVAKPQR